MSKEDSSEEILLELSADIVSFKHNSNFLKRLFNEDAGTMLYAKDLSTDLHSIESRIVEIEGIVKGSLRVGWLDFSNSPYGRGFALVIFFVEEIFWNTVAIYNRNLL